MNFAVRATDERFQVAPQFRLGGKRGEPREVRGGFLVQEMEAVRLLDGEPVIEFRIEPVEKLFEFRPGRTLGGDEARKVDNHLGKVESRKLRVESRRLHDLVPKLRLGMPLRAKLRFAWKGCPRVANAHRAGLGVTPALRRPRSTRRNTGLNLVSA